MKAQKQNFNYSRLLIAAFIIMLGLIVIFGVVAIKQTSVLSDLTRKMYDHPLTVSNSVLEANNQIIAMHRYMKDVVLARDDVALLIALEQVNQAETEVYRQLDIAMVRFLGDKAKIVDARQAFVEWKSIRTDVIVLSKKYQYAEAAAITKGRGADHVTLLTARMDGLIDFARNKADEFLAQSEEVYQASYFTLVMLMLVLVLIGGFVALLVYRYMQRQISVIEQSERHFNQLANNINDVFWIGSLDWQDVIYVSKAYESIWGLKVDSLYGDGRSWLKSVHEGDRERVLNDINQDISTVKDFLDFQEYRVIHPSGKVRWVSARAYPVSNDHGEIFRSAAVIVDITERKHAEELIRQSQKMDALGKLTGGIAHDYNNMLTIILGFSEMLALNLADDKKLLNYVEEISRAGARGKSLTEKLLDFSKHKLSQEKIVNINYLLKSQWQLLEKTLTVRVKLKFNLYEGLWDSLIDEGDFQDAIINMCINAMHAMPSGGVWEIKTDNFTVKAGQLNEHELKSGEYVRVSIIDTGLGMSSEVKSHIFDPFFSTKDNKGTGLGLSQVYGFMQRSKGAITVDSEVNIGTCFKLYFPR